MLANHIKCTQLNPPITEVIMITIATITYPNKLGINPKWMNMQHLHYFNSVFSKPCKEPVPPGLYPIVPPLRELSNVVISVKEVESI